ncbi:MAG: hypothetical protein LBT23_10060 [Synergistaceae bacterium]|nr:hypothetical protein [Synergistaceae bacterium]
MKKIICFLLLSLLPQVSFAYAGEEYMADPGAEPADFRGIKWQQALIGLPDMVEQYREEDGSRITCRRKNEDLTFGSAELDNIEYIFVDGKLSMVAVVAKGDKNKAALLDSAHEMFGRETLLNGDDYMWRFTDVAIMFSPEPDDQSVLFYQYIGFLKRR